MNAIAKAAYAQIQWKHPQARTDGFYAAVKDLISHCYNDEDADELRDQPWLLEIPRTPPCSDSELRQLWRDIYKPSFHPDLYEVDVANGQITLYEVEDSHPLDEEKLCKIIKWWFTIDDLLPGPGGVRLIVTDRYGQNERELPLSNLYFDLFVIPSNSAAAINIADRMGIKLHNSSEMARP